MWITKYKIAAKYNIFRSYRISFMCEDSVRELIHPFPLFPPKGFQGFQPPTSGAGFPPQQEAPPQPALPPAPIPHEAKGVHDVLSRLFGAAMQRAPNLVSTTFTAGKQNHNS